MQQTEKLNDLRQEFSILKGSLSWAENELEQAKKEVKDAVGRAMELEEELQSSVFRTVCRVDSPWGCLF